MYINELDTKVATNLVGCSKDINKSMINTTIKYIFVKLVIFGSKMRSKSYYDGLYLFSIQYWIYLTIVSGYVILYKILLDYDLYVIIFVINYLNS